MKSHETVGWCLIETLSIAATAAAYGLTVLTANLRRFTPLNLPAHNPLESLPRDYINAWVRRSCPDSKGHQSNGPTTSNPTTREITPSNCAGIAGSFLAAY
jgi:hypothetical protein